MASKAIEVEGLKQFQMAVRRAVSGPLPKEMGEAHREIGELVITKLDPKPDPKAVGSGKGATVRASASKRDVLLRVGGSHRASGEHTRKQPWGRLRVVRPGTPAPDRPHIRGTIDKHADEIGDAYLKAISQAMSGAFAETNP